MNAGRILILEDDDNARSALAELLRDAGYEISAAATKGAAVFALGAFHPDVILANVGAKAAEGFELALVVSLLPHPPAVAFMSAEPAERFIHASKAAAKATWVEKPIDLPTLLATLDRLAHRG